MPPMKLCIVAGARPNFMKIAPIIDAIKKHNKMGQKIIEYILIHSGQHYDKKMSMLFFDDLKIPVPKINLEVGSASHAEQTAEVMKRFEAVCLKEEFTHILVVGDINSTLACALVGSKMNIKIIHVEAGLRSFDRSMPEEINRILTDAISDFLFTTEESANQNLLREGIQQKKIYFVGNVMIDTLLKHNAKAKKSKILHDLGLMNFHSHSRKKRILPYAVVTLHRPSNVDRKDTLSEIIKALIEISKNIPIIFPVHPRSWGNIRKFHLESFLKLCSNKKTYGKKKDVHIIEPLGYLDFLQLMSNAKLVLTDSGGIQEETTILGIPCVTLRNNTERPVTVTHGTNLIAGIKKENIIRVAFAQLNRTKSLYRTCKAEKKDKLNIPPLWDGKAAQRIVNVLIENA